MATPQDSNELWNLIKRGATSTERSWAKMLNMSEDAQTKRMGIFGHVEHLRYATRRPSRILAKYFTDTIPPLQAISFVKFIDHVEIRH
ncbi:hypothetical protein D3870_07310 [Noviherbaspirillum cavernae]|uniref:Uncharacterized protein n=1 Tax=Noviherbaspirillum cavernae TaxID=2320862 RepID=A0A418X032_9BURK|nr:hypothetical protein D3870_07310 [Noviherbaspirillum cavernae]